LLIERWVLLGKRFFSCLFYFRLVAFWLSSPIFCSRKLKARKQKQKRRMQRGDGRFDDVFMGLAQQHGGIQPLLDSFFGFLHRRTDFYVQVPEGTRASMGFPPGAAEKMVREHALACVRRSCDGFH
jgi:hypothetical protein